MFRPETIALFTLRRVKREARLIFNITPDGEILRETNPEGRLNVLAVVGPGIKPLNGCLPVKEAVLLELGFRKARPYQKTRQVKRRMKQFVLSPEQYLLVAESVWRELEERVEEAVREWKCPTFTLSTRRQFYRRSRREVVSNTRQKSCIRGLRFSLDTRDELFFSDLCWAERHLCEQVRDELDWLTRLVDSCFSNNRAPLPPSRFKKLNGYKTLCEVFARREIPDHLLPEILMGLPNWQHHPHIYNLAESGIFQWDFDPNEMMKAREVALPGQRDRLRNVQVRIRNHDPSKGQVISEFFPSKKLLSELAVPEEDYEEEDEVPF